MSPVCVECQSEDIIQDDCHLVCQSCGTIQEDTVNFEHRVDSEGGFNFVGYENKLSGKRKFNAEPPGLYSVRIKIQDICSSLKLPEEVTEAALRYYLSVYKNDFKLKRLPTKLCLGGVVSYIAARMYNYPVLISDILSQLDNEEERQKFHTVFHKAKSSLDLTFPSLSVEESVNSILIKSKIPEQLHEQTCQLVKISVELWKQHSLQKGSLVTSCAYISWLGSDFCTNPKISLSRFTKEYGLVNHSCSGTVVKKLKEKLCQMAECIPWVGTVAENKVALYVSDIISYQKTLLKQAFTDEEYFDNLLPKRPKGDVKSEEEMNRIDEQIRQENPQLNHPELNENEFNKEIEGYLRTEEEKTLLGSLKALSSVVSSSTSKKNKK